MKLILASLALSVMTVSAVQARQHHASHSGAFRQMSLPAIAIIASLLAAPVVAWLPPPQLQGAQYPLPPLKTGRYGEKGTSCEGADWTYQTYCRALSCGMTFYGPYLTVEPALSAIAEEFEKSIPMHAAFQHEHADSYNDVPDMELKSNPYFLRIVNKYWTPSPERHDVKNFFIAFEYSRVPMNGAFTQRPSGEFTTKKGQKFKWDYFCDAVRSVKCCGK